METRKHTRFENKKILVLGLALSGFHAAKLLLELGAYVTVNDAKELDENPDAQELITLGAKVITGQHPLELLNESFSYMVKNPGIPYSNPMVEKALEMGIPILTDVEIAADVLEANLICVTGTNGKTTTTTMITNILNQDRVSGKAYKAGNIGIPATLIAEEASENDDVIMELSSFQLMGIDQLHPHIAILTNISEAHLDYHGTREEYVKAKWRITENQIATDYLVLNWDQEELQMLSKQANAQIIPFSRMQTLDGGVYIKNDAIYYGDERVMPLSSLRVPGSHNIENALAAIAVAKIEKIPNQIIEKAFLSFHGVKHRIQYVDEIKGRVFYNDSKATNILAAQTALDSFPNQKVILLAGGLDRGNTFDELIPFLKNVKAMIVFGETAEKLAQTAKEADISDVKISKDVRTAVIEGYARSEEEDVILLSPACASWDQYQNFEVRGDQFIKAVQDLKEKKDEVNGPL
ncbi:UDP-N-acetylmuramoyl-L-alanine--D-glutamate ligase [Jeotgalibaca sp. MA1X17-3]|uniref:UDP-N-acetylmuramoyl-L-alanine--D-glutamate ligase n=1 Tax=Jeotgalibaca sp. MA1X17-3 TaxID=2908211 RepID=UPI001F1F73C2|nr:UDP-N-acetylmuramoyl-L-alanine--D-glutamate ligase [Jeotgalibaca sp. MA1X17-3]UJF15126.1 UDP-N-acetylmuramoyl-L-alanine--D-glutamate ligase [Jeotgalibaca sp. MA1X17-3]